MSYGDLVVIVGAVLFIGTIIKIFNDWEKERILEKAIVKFKNDKLGRYSKTYKGVVVSAEFSSSGEYRESKIFFYVEDVCVYKDNRFIHKIPKQIKRDVKRIIKDLLKEYKESIKEEQREIKMKEDLKLYEERMKLKGIYKEK